MGGAAVCPTFPWECGAFSIMIWGDGMKYAYLSRFRSELMGVAMLWVMLFHAENLDLGWGPLNTLRSAGFGGVDIFIVLSAMGLVMSLGRREQDDHSFLVRRARRILPAYFLVMVPYTLFCLARGTAWLSALVWNATLLNYWVRPKGSFNWYVSGIMLFYALTPACFRWLREPRGRLVRVAGGMGVGLLVCRILIRDGYWNHMDFFYRVPVFLLGLLLGFFLLEERPFSRRDGLFWLGWALRWVLGLT